MLFCRSCSRIRQGHLVSIVGKVVQWDNKFVWIWVYCKGFYDAVSMLGRRWMHLCVKWCNDGCLATCQGIIEKLARNSGNSMVSYEADAALMMRDLNDFWVLGLCSVRPARGFDSYLKIFSVVPHPLPSNHLYLENFLSVWFDPSFIKDKFVWNSRVISKLVDISRNIYDVS